MSRGKLWSLILMGLLAVVLIFNSKDSISVNLMFDSIKMVKSLWLLIFTVTGVVIGLLFR